MGWSQLSLSSLPRDLLETCWSCEQLVAEQSLAACSQEACRHSARQPAAGRFAAQPGQPPSCPVRGEFLIPPGACFSSLHSHRAILGALQQTHVACWLLKHWACTFCMLGEAQQRKSFLSALPSSSQHPILFGEAFCSQAARCRYPRLGDAAGGVPASSLCSLSTKHCRAFSQPGDGEVKAAVAMEILHAWSSAVPPGEESSKPTPVASSPGRNLQPRCRDLHFQLFSLKLLFMP